VQLPSLSDVLVASAAMSGAVLIEIGTFIASGLIWAMTMTLDPTHNQAIREEIGERLRFLLMREQSTLPPSLR
jgi:hypothetical protein